MGSLESEFLERWHRIVVARDLDSLSEILAAAPTLGAPPYWQRLAGRDVVHHLLGIIIETIEEFTYHREWVDERELALEFTGKVAGMDLQGIDLISIDRAGRLVNIDVMIRPINAVEALMERVTPRMTEFFAARTPGD
jgi:hypothetical protein